MLNRKYKNLPKDIIEAGISLEELGIYEMAWKIDEIKKIIELLRKEKVPVLGGDVYKIVDDKIESTYDSWFLNNNGQFDFIEKSLDKSISYIEEYELINYGKNIYVLVF